MGLCEFKTRYNKLLEQIPNIFARNNLPEL